MSRKIELSREEIVQAMFEYVQRRPDIDPTSIIHLEFDIIVPEQTPAWNLKVTAEIEDNVTIQ